MSGAEDRGRVVSGVSEVSSMDLVWKNRGGKAALFDLTDEHNMRRIQAFLDEPLKHLGDASDRIRFNLQEKGVALDADVASKHRRRRHRDSHHQEQPRNREARKKSGGGYPVGSVEAARVMRKFNAVERHLGPRSRFSDGDGTFWDRWLNTTGCLDGQGNYLEATAPVRPGNLIPWTGYKEALGAPLPVIDPDAPSALKALMESLRKRDGEASRRRLGKYRDDDDDDGRYQRGEFSTAYRAATGHQQDNEQQQPSATTTTTTTQLEKDAIEEVLSRLDATTRTDEAGVRHVALASQGLTPAQVAGLSECVLRVAGTIRIGSVDVSGNDIGTSSLNVLFDALAALSETLKAVDLSGVEMPFSSIDVLSASLSSGRFRGLTTLCIASVSLDDALTSVLVRALRDSNAPSLETLDLASNAVGSIDSQRPVVRLSPEQNDAKYVNDDTGGPVGALLDPDFFDPDSPVNQGSMKTLNLSWNLLRPEVAAGLGRAVARHACLRRLHLAHNVLGDAGIIDLASSLSDADSARAPSLEILDVGWNGAGPRGAACLAAACHALPSLTCLDASGNPIGATGACLHMSVSLAETPRKNNGALSTRRVVLRGCDASSSDERRYVFDWLYRVPAIRLDAPTPYLRCPWQFRYQLDSPLDRAFAREVLRITADDGRFERCSVRHVAAFDPASASNSASAPEDAMSPGKKRLNRGVAKLLADRKRYSSKGWKKKKKRIVKHLSDLVDLAGDMTVVFALLERASKRDDPALLDRASKLEFGAKKLYDAALKTGENAFLDFDAARSLAHSLSSSSRGGGNDDDDDDENAGVVSKDDVDRAFLLYDWRGTGEIARTLFAKYLAYELPRLLRLQAVLPGPNYWAVGFERRVEPINRGQNRKGVPPQRGESSPRREEDERQGTTPLFTEGKEEMPVPKKETTRWRLPTEGLLDLRFQLGATGSRPLRSVERILASVDAFGEDLEAALSALADAGIALDAVGGLQVASALLGPASGTKIRNAGSAKNSGGSDAQHLADLDVKVVKWIATVAVGPAHARAVRDAVLGKLQLCDPRCVANVRRCRKCAGANLYKASFGTRAGRYVLDLSDADDRATLRLLLEDDAAEAAADLAQSSVVFDGSQRGGRSRFRNAIIKGEKSRQVTGGEKGHLDPRVVATASERAATSQSAASMSEQQWHALFDPRNSGRENAAERRALLSDLGASKKGRVVLDYAPTCRLSTYAGGPPPADAWFLEVAQAFGWIAPKTDASPSESTPEALAKAFLADVRDARRRLSLSQRDFGYCLGGRASALQAWACVFAGRENDVQSGTVSGTEAQNKSDDSCRGDTCVFSATLESWKEALPAPLPSGGSSSNRRKKLAAAAARYGGVLSEDQIEAAVACDAVRRARLRKSAPPKVGAGVSSNGTSGPDASLEDAQDLVASLPILDPAQAVALLAWCPLAADGDRPPDPPGFGDANAEFAWGRAFVSPQISERDERHDDDLVALADRRVELLATLGQRVAANHAVWCDLFRVLTPFERGTAWHRLGPLAAWSPVSPDGFYALDVAVREDRCLVKALVLLEAAEPKSVLTGLCAFDHVSDLRAHIDDLLQRALSVPQCAPENEDGILRLSDDDTKKNDNTSLEHNTSTTNKPGSSSRGGGAASIGIVSPPAPMDHKSNSSGGSGSNNSSPDLDTDGRVHQAWRLGPPTAGLYTFTFRSSPEPNLALRHALAAACTNTRRRDNYDFGATTPLDVINSAIYHASLSYTYSDFLCY